MIIIKVSLGVIPGEDVLGEAHRGPGNAHSQLHECSPYFYSLCGPHIIDVLSVYVKFHYKFVVCEIGFPNLEIQVIIQFWYSIKGKMFIKIGENKRICIIWWRNLPSILVLPQAFEFCYTYASISLSLPFMVTNEDSGLWSMGCSPVLVFFLFNFLFYIGVQLINNVEFVSGVQQSDSVIHTHVSILFQSFFPFRLLHNIEQSSLCYTAGPCWLSILNIAVCIC